MTCALGGFQDLAVEDTVQVRAVNNSSNGMGSWIMGNLSVDSPTAQFRANGKWFSLLLSSLNGVITEPEDGYIQYYDDLNTSTVYNAAGTFVRNAWVTITGEEMQAEGLRGDVNLDGQVGIGDIVAITNIMAGIETDPGMVARADVNGDGEVGIGDIVAITNIMAGE